MKLQPNQLKSGRWCIQLWNEKKYCWTLAPGTSTFVSKENAMVGIKRYRYKHEGRDFVKMGQRVMASIPFCKGIKL